MRIEKRFYDLVKTQWDEIEKEAGCFLLPSLGSQAIHKVFSNLFLAANDACVDISPGGLCKIEFCFWLYQEVPASMAT